MKHVAGTLLSESVLAHLRTGRAALGVDWLDLGLYAEAMTTNAYCSEQKFHPLPSQHRLEYIGDAVLGLVVRRYLSEALPRIDVAHLSALCQTYVSNAKLKEAAERLGLDRYALPSKGKVPLADTYEALIGACFVGGDFERAEAFVRQTYLDVVFPHRP